jgi:ABC-type branched-subunit amino acid transport system substrate-binding protein
MGIETMVFIVENNATALSGYNAASQAFEKLGGKILGKEVFETGATDFFTPLTRLKNMNADALFICSNPEPAGLIIKQTKEIGWPVQTIAEGNPPTGPAFWEIGGKAIEGHLDLTAVPGLDPGPKLTKLIGFDPALRKKFWDGFQAEYKMDPNLVTAQYYYDYTHLAVEAMKAAASIDDTEKIRQALLDMEWKGVYEKWTFYPNGQCWNFTTVSVIHAGKGWTGMAFIEPGDREFKTFKIHELMPTPKIKDIRKQRGY